MKVGASSRTYGRFCITKLFACSFWESPLRRAHIPAGVKRRSCRSTQVNKTLVKSCRSKLVTMGPRALGLQPIDVASATVQRSQSQICSITKMPINVVYSEIHCFFESFESLKNSIITGFCNVFIFLKLRLKSSSFIYYVKTDDEFMAKNYCMRLFFITNRLKET